MNTVTVYKSPMKNQGSPKHRRDLIDKQRHIKAHPYSPSMVPVSMNLPPK